MNEHQLSAKVRQFLADLERQKEPIFSFKVSGNPMQRANLPDRILCVRGHFAALEEKSPADYPTGIGTPTPGQANVLRHISEAGGTIACLSDLDMIKAWVTGLLVTR